jgi:putative CocE/NonD family hydrolase
VKTKSDFPRPVRKIENTWIPMSDGCRLAATIWLPEDAERDPVPAILEYIPYRKNDARARGDAITHPYFAGHGYAAVRVDLRGSGDSDGVLLDEYLPREHEDALEALSWIAAQPWCTGSVGMMGYSWGGFNSLQIAALGPPELEAIISVYAADDRYADDVHYMGGCVVGNEMLEWASTMWAYNVRPPDPANVGKRWRDMWLERLEGSPPFVETWLAHQRRDAYWKHGSVCEDYGTITCPVYAVGGWADGYTNAVPRLLEGLSVPRKGLIGGWPHGSMADPEPGPAIGFLQEFLRWWDHWLKGIDTGIMDEPMLRVWLPESVTPSANPVARPGRWVAEPSWPTPNVTSKTYWLNRGTLDEEPAIEHPLDLRGSQTTGLYAGMWCPSGMAGEFPADQRIEDSHSLTFTSAPVDEPMEILGFPEVTLVVSVDQPNALLAVRLCDVAPGGDSLLVSRGLLNLTHRESHEHPSPLEPGRRYTVTVRLNVIGHVLPAGHRWRVAVSPTYWPQAWPSPASTTLRVFTGGGSQLALPVRPPRPGEAPFAPFQEPEGAEPLEVKVIRAPSRNWAIGQDVVAGRFRLVTSYDAGAQRLRPNGIEYEQLSRETYTIVEGDPLSAQVRCQRTIKIGRGDWRTRIDTDSTMSSTATEFHVTQIAFNPGG